MTRETLEQGVQLQKDITSLYERISKIENAQNNSTAALLSIEAIQIARNMGSMSKEEVSEIDEYLGNFVGLSINLLSNYKKIFEDILKSL
jgi:hypothetical protein